MTMSDQAKQHYDRGVELEEQGKIAEAAEEYGAAIALEPDNPEFRDAH